MNETEKHKERLRHLMKGLPPKDEMAIAHLLAELALIEQERDEYQSSYRTMSNRVIELEEELESYR